MSTGHGMLKIARQHIGEKYENVLVPKNNPNWKGPWDCAEFVSWIVFQDVGILYGCIDNTTNPAVAEAYTGGWQKDSVIRGIRVSIDQATATPGGILLRYPPAPGRMGHIAICDGEGGTVEAKGHAFGVVADTVHGRRWDTGILVPGVYYDEDVSPVNPTSPTKIYYQGARGMDRKVVRDIQEALFTARFDPGSIDGIYGAKTAAAVAAFQRVNGLVMDGEVGPHTAKKLGVEL
jgi:putative peptidoglycan binding protein